MVTYSQSDVLAHEAKISAKKKPAQADGDPVKIESVLMDKIIEDCGSRWPQWVCLWARRDKKSTLPVGCHDLTIFCQFPNVILIEGKARNEKPDKDQLIWHKRLEMLGWTVHVVRDWATWKKISNIAKPVDCLTSARCAGDAEKN